MPKTGNSASASSPIQDYVEELHREILPVKDGQVATYIPELGKADPDKFGICLVTATGAVYEAGDVDLPFTIQSISKPFVYGLALEDQGRAQVISKVGMEPTGDAFNSISLEPGTGRPRNPMINAGAIATTALIAGKSPKTRLRRLMDTFSTYAGRELGLDEAVYRSESETGHRNRAIAHMLRNFDILSGDPIPAVELYFQQCSISVTCHDLGVMAGTLANRGVNPLTGRQAIRGEYVESVLSVMGSCGMYDFAGEWIYNIGMPAKSGVAGGVIAVLPGQLGIGIFSPALDSRGNSVRGIRVCDAISRHCDLHLFNRSSPGKTAVRLRFSGAEFSSNRIRNAEQCQLLRQNGQSIQVFQLQGHLTFATTETIIRDVFERLNHTDHVILDFKRVLTANESSCRLFYQLLTKCSQLAKTVQFTQIQGIPLLRRYMKAKLAGRFETLFRAADDTDLALEWCENQLLQASGRLVQDAEAATPDQYEFCEHFTGDELKAFSSLLHHRSYRPNETIMDAGDAANEMFFLARGRVSVFIAFEEGAQKRLATFSPGMVFGEMAFIDGSPRSAGIKADTEVECDVLTRENFDKLSGIHPGLKIKLLDGILLSLCHRLRKANRELSLLQ